MDIQGEFCGLEIPEPCGILLFGASGDLTKRKIIPALYKLFVLRLLPNNFFVLGAARTKLSDIQFREKMKKSIIGFLNSEFNKDVWDKFSKHLFYQNMVYSNYADYHNIDKRLVELETKFSTRGNRIYYLATPPAVYETIITGLGTTHMSIEKKGYTHVVLEKPFGYGLSSAKALNNTLSKYFSEQQVYRMDHYLAKETVQNILVFRFANTLFEPLWNNKYIDHVQITVSETLGVEHRAGYYERAGVLRDMFQNHLFQLLALTTMEPPARLDPESVRDEKVKVFKSIRPFSLANLEEQLVIAQYAEGIVEGNKVLSYRQEPNVAHNSTTPTFAAIKVFVDNWRWKDVPFYIRSGKRLKKKKALISLFFKPVPHMLFPGEAGELRPNVIVIKIQPEEEIEIYFQSKQPGSKICLNTSVLKFSFPISHGLQGYERVLLDCMQGDQMLFVRADGAEQTWKLLTPVLEKIEKEQFKKDIPLYEAGSEGPQEAISLIENDGRKWLPL